MQTNRSQGNRSRVNITQSGLPFIEDQKKSEFELMHIKVTVLGLTGIVNERLSNKMSKRKPPKKIVLNQTATMSQVSTASSISFVDNDFSESAQIASVIPTVALVTFHRNVTNNQTSIATHVPSLELEIPTIVGSVGTESRCVASWPTCTSSFPAPNSKIDRASYSFSRVMMRESFVSTLGHDTTYNSTFINETIDLHISLGQGKDMIPLGLAPLFITGNEEGTELLNLPAKAVTYKKNKLVLGPRETKGRATLFQSTAKKMPSFPSDPSTGYRLSENANLRILVKVLPHAAFEAAEASEAALAKQVFESKRLYQSDLNGLEVDDEYSTMEQQENDAHAGNMFVPADEERYRRLSHRPKDRSTVAKKDIHQRHGHQSRRAIPDVYDESSTMEQQENDAHAGNMFVPADEERYRRLSHRPKDKSAVAKKDIHQRHGPQGRRAIPDVYDESSTMEQQENDAHAGNMFVPADEERYRRLSHRPKDRSAVAKKDIHQRHGPQGRRAIPEADRNQRTVLTFSNLFCGAPCVPFVDDKNAPIPDSPMMDCTANSGVLAEHNKRQYAISAASSQMSSVSGSDSSDSSEESERIDLTNTHIYIRKEMQTLKKSAKQLVRPLDCS